MADYVTTDEVGELAHEFTLSPTLADALVTRASRLFDNLTGVTDDFYKAAATPAAYSNRVFFGNGTGYLQIDPYTALNPVNPVVIDPAYGYDIPTYKERDGMLVFYGSFIQRFTGWNDGVQVTVSANWGFPSVPPPVTQACAAIAIHLWRTSDPAFATISNAEGAVQADLPEIAKDIIETYKAKYMPGFAFA